MSNQQRRKINGILNGDVGVENDKAGRVGVSRDGVLQV